MINSLPVSRSFELSLKEEPPSFSVATELILLFCTLLAARDTFEEEFRSIDF